MDLTTAVLVDDCVDQRDLLARVLSRAGWAVHTADSTEGEALATRILAGPAAAQTVILTDMHMLGDPYAANFAWVAGGVPRAAPARAHAVGWAAEALI